MTSGSILHPFMAAKMSNKVKPLIMKQFITFLSLMMFAFTLNAQYIYNDYDANQNETFLGWENNPVLTANPDPTGINTSTNVARWDRTWQQYCNVWADLSGTIDFSTGTVFSMKVWSPIACDVLFKLENGGGAFTERLLTISTPNQWVQLNFDFAGEASGIYNKVVFFIDFASFNTNTFYFDDIQGPHHSGSLVKPLLAADVQDNFENNGWGTIDNWIFQNPGLDPLPTTADPEDASNTVAYYNRNGAFQYTNAQAELDHRMDLSERNIFEVKVYFPSSNDYSGDLSNTAAFKLQNSLMGGNAWMTQAQIIHTVDTYDEWVTLTFDFSAVADSVNYDKIVVQLGGEGHWAPGQFYYDDLQLLYITPPFTYNDFDTAQHVEFVGWPNVPAIVSNPDVSGINTSANVAEWVRSPEQWSHVSANLEGPVNFSEASNFQLKVHSAVSCPVLFKLEQQANSAVFVERQATIYETDQWTLLNFDFSGEASETYDKIIIFFDFASFNDNTFYFDDIMGPDYDGPKPILDIDVQDNFENNGWSTIDHWILQDASNDTLQTTMDPENSNNHVADYDRSGSFQYTNAQTVLEHRLDLSERNKFEIDVYFPSSNNYGGSLTPTAALKLQNSLMGPNAWQTQTEIVHTISTFDEWQTVLFDFSAIADSINYDQIVVQLGGEGHWEPAQFYFDNFYLKHVPYVTVLDPNGGEEVSQGNAYEIEWEFDYWNGNIKIELQKGAQTPSLIVSNIPASDLSYTWNVSSTQETGDDFRVIITSLDNDYPSDTSDAYFSIVEAAAIQANFSADATSVTVGDSVMFTDLSAGVPTTWEWTFEGGSPETFNGQQPPYIHYETAGTYDVSLLVSNGSSYDFTVMEDYITVGVPPVAGFEASTNQLFAGGTVDFTSLSQGEELSYEWHFEGGAPATSEEANPSGILYAATGIYDVTLIVTNPFGSDTLVEEDYIDVLPVGLAESDNPGFSIYPNPASDFVTIVLGPEAAYSVQIMTTQGTIVADRTVKNRSITSEVTGLASGIYLVKVTNLETGSLVVKKFIIR